MVLRDPKGCTVGGKQLWANGFLPALYQGTEFNMSGSPVHHLKPAQGLPPGVQEQGLDYLARINRLRLDARPDEIELESCIRNSGLAARMQVEAMDVLDIESESPATKKLYGVDDQGPRPVRVALPSIAR